jgi:glycerol uptake facilitator-like aquaporin
LCACAIFFLFMIKKDKVSLFRGNAILSAQNRQEVEGFFANGTSQKRTDISKVNQATVQETEARFKKIMSSSKKTIAKTSSESIRNKNGSTTLISIAKSINKRLGLTVFFCELLGSFLVELFACLSTKKEDAFAVVAISIGILNLIFQDVSGAQFHPCLTISRWFVSNNNRWLTMIQDNKVHKRAIVNNTISGVFAMVAQFFGVVLATFVAVGLRGLLPEQEPPNASAWIVFVVEFVCFFCIVLMFISTNKTLYLFRPFYLVLTWYGVGFVSNSYSGAILNPYRWIAVTIFSQRSNWSFAWAYILAPFCSTLCAVQIFVFLKL